MELDRYLPDYDFNEVHTIEIDASPENSYTAFKTLRVSELSRLADWLMKIRGLPAKLINRNSSLDSPKEDRVFLKQMLENGFILLSDTKQEIVFGMIGQFWKPVGNQPLKVATPDEFLKFKKEGYVKVAANMLFKKTGDKTVLTSETRVCATDSKARIKFALYWLIIRPASGLIRIIWLNAIKKKAESIKGAKL